MPFSFRLRFRTAIRFTSDDTRLIVPASDNGPELEISAVGSPDVTLRRSEWLDIKVAGFPTEATAINYASRLKDSLLTAGAQCIMGFDLGHDTGGSFSQEIREQLEANRIRSSVHGIDVFEGDIREYGFAQVDIRADVTYSPSHFVERFEKIRAHGAALAENQRLALELINDSIFPATPDAQLVLRVAAIEVLSQQGWRSDPVRALLTELISALDKVQGDPKDKELVCKILQGSMKQPIGEACRETIRALLGVEQEGNFRRIARARNKLLHSGEGRGTNAAAAGDALFLAVALASADIGVRYNP